MIVMFCQHIGAVVWYVIDLARVNAYSELETGHLHQVDWSTFSSQKKIRIPKLLRRALD
jgi:hypothetical protein